MSQRAQLMCSQRKLNHWDHLTTNKTKSRNWLQGFRRSRSYSNTCISTTGHRRSYRWSIYKESFRNFSPGLNRKFSRIHLLALISLLFMPWIGQELLLRESQILPSFGLWRARLRVCQHRGRRSWNKWFLSVGWRHSPQTRVSATGICPQEECRNRL
jgi:hypothetical protein